MKELLDKYARKLVAAGLAEEGAPLLSGLDVELVWNRPDPACAELEKLFQGLAINSLLFAQPAEPYRSLIDYVAGHAAGPIRPGDSETRTFMHEIPVFRTFAGDAVITALKSRKSVVIGFVGKFYLFSSVIAGGFYGLAIIGVLTSLVSAYYYLRVVVTMYMQDGERVRSRESFLDLTTGLTAVATVVIRLVPQFLFARATSAVLKLF